MELEGATSGEAQGHKSTASAHQEARLVATRKKVIDDLAKSLAIGREARVLLTHEGEGQVDGLQGGDELTRN